MPEEAVYMNKWRKTCIKGLKWNTPLFTVHIGVALFWYMVCWELVFQENLWTALCQPSCSKNLWRTGVARVVISWRANTTLKNLWRTESLIELLKSLGNKEHHISFWFQRWTLSYKTEFTLQTFLMPLKFGLGPTCPLRYNWCCAVLSFLNWLC